jgi:hypothetical protein
MLSILVPCGSCNIHGAISPEARVIQAPLYIASSILVSVKMRLSIFVKQGKCVFDFFIKVQFHAHAMWNSGFPQEKPPL